MGQFVLGIRSLLVKLAVFVVMAALLAWALGGTLFPRPSRAEIFAISALGSQWHWRVAVYDRRALDAASPEEHIQWQLIRKDQDGKSHVLEDAIWYEVAGPAASASGTELWFGGRSAIAGNSESPWTLLRVDQTYRIVERRPMPDRLAVEHQLARIAAGLPVQDIQTIAAQRQAVLDPQGESADEGEGVRH